MKIAIKFGDNDFYYTFFPLMEALHTAYVFTEKLPNNKPQLLKLINSLSYGFHLLYQNQFEYNDLTIDSPDKEYLIIDESKLLLNEEVDEYLKSLEPYGGFDNSSTFILDTGLYNSNVYVV